MDQLSLPGGGIERPPATTESLGDFRYFGLHIMPIRFVYFDLGNVLIGFDRQRTNAGVAKLFGVDPLVADAAVHGSGRLDAMESGELTGEQFAEQIRDELGGHDVDTQTLLDAVCDMFTPVAAMNGIVAAVRQRVGGVGILSNTCAAHWGWIARMAYPVMDTAFDVTVTSYARRLHEAGRSDLPGRRGRGGSIQRCRPR